MALSGKDYVCGYCGKLFWDDKEALAKHLITHQKDEIYLVYMKPPGERFHAVGPDGRPVLNLIYAAMFFSKEQAAVAVEKLKASEMPEWKGKVLYEIRKNG